jgi:hypothetical protein
VHKISRQHQQGEKGDAERTSDFFPLCKNQVKSMVLSIFSDVLIMLRFRLLPALRPLLLELLLELLLLLLLELLLLLLELRLLSLLLAPPPLPLPAELVELLFPNVGLLAAVPGVALLFSPPVLAILLLALYPSKNS